MGMTNADWKRSFNEVREERDALQGELEALRAEVGERDKEHEALLALCRSKLGTMDVHGIADGIEQLAALRKGGE